MNTRKNILYRVLFIGIVALIVVSVVVIFYVRDNVTQRQRKNSTASQRSGKLVVHVPLFEHSIDLRTGTGREFWKSIAAVTQGLVYQTTVPPWPHARKSEDELQIRVKAFHNGEKIYIHVEWRDDTEDRATDLTTFFDGVALLFSLTDIPSEHALLMGTEDKVNIWQWKAEQDAAYWLNYETHLPPYSDYYYPFENEEVLIVSRRDANLSAFDLISTGVGSVDIKAHQTISARGVFAEGVWNVVFTRALTAKNVQEDIDFKQGSVYCALAVWNGSLGDRGGRKLISDWVELVITQL